ncbi:MAG: ketopantoate reductase family protein [Candidatus Dormibacteraceae bacterium]
MRYGVLGAGGIGGLVGGALARAGHDVVLIVRDPSHPAALTVESQALGNFEVAVPATTRLDQPVDVLWVTTKATQLEPALAAAPAAMVGGTVVPLLNGCDHVALLRQLYPTVTPGVIRVESERVGPGQIRQLGQFLAVQLAGHLAAEISADVAATGITCTVAADETSMLWSKLTMLAALALTTTARGTPIGVVRDEPIWRERLLGVTAEAGAVAAALGAEVDVDQVRGVLLAAPPGFRSSMQKDRQAGRPIELDAIAGPIIRGGQAHGIPTPHTDELVAMLGA